MTSKPTTQRVHDDSELESLGSFAERLEGRDLRSSSAQVGLIDLFYFTTLICVVVACGSFVSQAAAIVVCAAIVVGCVVHWLPSEYGAIGGLKGFGASLICLPLVLRFAGWSSIGGIGFCLLFPTAAYVLGAIYTEMRALD